MSIFITAFQISSWIIFLALIPLIFAALWLKNRSSIQCWVRIHRQPERWLLVTAIPEESSPATQASTLERLVERAQNDEWPSSCVYHRHDRAAGKRFIGLISNKRPQNNPDADTRFTKLPASIVLRASGAPRDEDVTVLDVAQSFCQASRITLGSEVYSLVAQSFHTWEWPLANDVASPGFVSQLMERVFEMRDIAFYPLIATPLTLAMLGTGNSGLFSIGVFAIILLSGSHKFVFLHQREDTTQERHLQNY